jgi:DNA-binding NarL/FixJ family response regulator
MDWDQFEPVRVLIVDDDPRVREALRCFLSGLPGFEVTADADSAAAAVAIARKNPPTVALVDLFLPDLGDGLELLRVLTGQLRVPVVAISIHDEYGRCALDAGAYQFVSKSCPPELLLGVLRAARF